MENLNSLESVTGLVSVNEMREQDMDKQTSIGNAPRKGLSDITNLLQQPKVLAKGAKLGIHPASLRSKDYIDKLQQENMMLMKVLAERNKVIELSGIELQKLRINLEKFQQQNLILAQANSQMLAELNSGKDRLKALNHKLGCKNAMLKAIKSEVRTSKPHMTDNVEEENKEDISCNTNSYAKAVEPLKGEDGENEPCNRNRRRKAQSLCPSNSKPVQSKEGADNKRVCLRRQSLRLKAQEPEVTEDAFAVGDTKILDTSSCDDKVHENGPTSSISSTKEQYEEGNIDKKRASLRRQSASFKPQKSELTGDAFEGNDTKFIASLSDDKVHEISSNSSIKKEHEEGSVIARTEAEKLRRTSVGRPLRRAAEKVQSYKEISIKMKMRRSE